MENQIEHFKFIKRCFQIAENANYHVRSNPKVGSVLVYNNKIISEGFHHQFGAPHAEVMCLNNPLLDPKIIEKSTLYVSLEPCSIYGKTPPCANKIIESGIKKVVIGSLDPNPKVNGKGVELLKNKGIEVLNLNLNEEQLKLNNSFIVNQTLNRPHFTAKYSVSINNKISHKNKQSKITPIEVDAIFHNIRSGMDAILIGKDTWAIDSPKLNNRYTFAVRQPNIIVLDSNLENNYDHFDGSLNRTLYVLNQIKTDVTSNIKYIQLNTKGIHDIIQFCNEQHFYNILIEGGAQILSFFSTHKMIDTLYINKNLDLKIETGIDAPNIMDSSFELIRKKLIKNIEVSHYQKHILY